MSHIFNLRGNARTSGEQRRKERGNVFGEGTRTPVAITLLVKNPAKKERGQIFYCDIGDYLTREDKLRIVVERGSIDGVKWDAITPNDRHEWVKQSNPEFDEFLPMGEKDAPKGDKSKSIFSMFSPGLLTARDEWAYNFSKAALIRNMKYMIEFYNGQIDEISRHCKGAVTLETLEAIIDNDPKKISWSSGLKAHAMRMKRLQCDETAATPSSYRPFTKEFLYFDRNLNDRVGQHQKIFPIDVDLPPPKQDACQTASAAQKSCNLRHGNRSVSGVLSAHGRISTKLPLSRHGTVLPSLRLRIKGGVTDLAICVTGIGATEFSPLMMNVVPDYNLMAAGCQCFPLYAYRT